MLVSGLSLILALAPLTPQDDKISHFTVSSTGTAAIIKGFQYFDPEHAITPAARITGALLLGLAGIAKEAADVRRGGKQVEGDSAGDLAADALGIAFGQVLTWEF
jgi:hypothetical protein